MPGFLRIDGVQYDDLFELEPVSIVQNDPFEFRPRTRLVSKVVFHESVTLDEDVSTDKDGTERTLRRKGYGVHLMADSDGELVQHNDLATETVIHARDHNSNAIGVEVVSPYYGKLWRKSQPWPGVIETKWAHRRSYVLPTRAQLETACRFVQAITEVQAGNVFVPRSFPGVKSSISGKTSVHMGLIPGLSRDFVRSSPGIWAHGYTEHSDGFFPVLYCYLVIGAGLSYDEAFDESVRLATGAGTRIVLPKEL